MQQNGETTPLYKSTSKDSKKNEWEIQYAGDQFTFPCANGSNPSRSHSNLVEGISGCPLGERGDGPDTANEHKGANEAKHDFWSRSGNFMYRHRVVNQENYMRIDKIISNFIVVH